MKWFVAGIFALLTSSLCLGQLKLSQQWAGPVISPVSDAIAFFDLQSRTLRLYGSLQDEKPFLERTFGPATHGLEQKTAGNTCYFLLIDNGQRVIHILDDRADGRDRQLPIPPGVSALLADPNPESPFVYYTYSNGPGERQQLGRFDVVTMAKTDDIKSDGSEGLQLLTMAEDRIYAMDTRAGEGALVCMEVREAAVAGGVPWLRSVGAVRMNPSSPLIASPTGAIIAGTIFDPYLKQVRVRMEASPQCLITGTPFVLAIAKGPKLQVVSINDGQVVAEIDPTKYAPAAPVAPAVGAAKPGVDIIGGSYQRGVVYDPRRASVIVRTFQALFSIPLKDFGLPQEPVVGVDLRSAQELVAGEKWSLPTTLPAGCVATLETAPRGVELAGEMLAWMPSNTDVGRHSIKLQITDGKRTWTQQIELNVRQPSVLLPSAPVTICTTPDGKRIVCHMRDDSGPKSRLVVVDAASRKLVADRSFDVPIASIAVNDTCVTAILTGKTALTVMSLPNLDGDRLIQTRDRYSRLRIVGGYVLATGNQSGGAGEWFTIQDGRPVDLWQGATKIPDRGMLINENVIETADGVVLDTTNLKPLWLSLPGSIVAVGSLAKPELKIPRTPLLEFRFGAVVEKNTLETVDGRQVTLADSSCVSTLLSDHPIWVTLPTSPTVAADRDTGRFRPSLAARELSRGIVVNELLLQDELQGRRNVRTSEWKMSAGTGLLAVLIDRRLFVLPTRALLPTGMAKPPLRIASKPETFLVKQGERATIEFEITGGEPPYELRLEEDFAGITLNAKQHAIVIDATAFAAGDLTGPAQAIRYNYRLSQGADNLRLDDKVAAYARIERNRIWQLFRTPFEGVPIAVNLQVRVDDAAHSHAITGRSVIVAVPNEHLSNALPDAQQANAQAANQANTLKRLNQLEQENQQLRKQVELLTDLLRERTSSTTRPTN